jgi:hypothetical protein
MPELKSCYFCGEMGDALTAVDVVPADLADEATQRTVVVCSTCQRKLDAVLAPLRNLAVAGGAGTTDVDAGTTDVDDGAATGDSTPTDEDATETADGAIDAESPLAPTDRVEESADDTESGGITFADAAESSDDDSLRGGAGDADGSLLGGDDGVALGSGSDAAAEDPEPEHDESDDDDAAEETAATSQETAGDDTAADTPSDDPPTGYRKVVRLLQNREFPVERASFVDLASNAYELEESAVSASLDRLVERGALVENGGKLQKP